MEITRTIPIEGRESYPRPDFIRHSWLDLNGMWEFAFEEDLKGSFPNFYLSRPLPRQIQVPFCYQAPASKVGDPSLHPRVFYAKNMVLDKKPAAVECLLKFGAVDYFCQVWVNGFFAGSHQGGHTQFELPVGAFLCPGENRILLSVEDDTSYDRPRGKQYWEKNPDRCWYTGTTGIWKSVWMEFTGSAYIRSFKLTPDIDRRCLDLELFLNQDFTGTLLLNCSYLGMEKKHMEISVNPGHYIRESMSLLEEDAVDEIHYWHPDSPNLYTLRLTLMDGQQILDCVDTYFGMRQISIQGDTVYLNHKPLYQRLVLDQGYWPESLMTPPSPEAVRYDIEITKEMGFNGARKHQKLEVPQYYYYADVLGLLVWCEMPSAYQFHDSAIRLGLSEWQECLTEAYNHPSIIAWVPLNESWGVRNILTDKKQQAYAACLYHLTHAYDSTRFLSTNDGWEAVDQTDVLCLHDYEESGEGLYERYADFSAFLNAGAPGRQTTAHGHGYHGQPVILSEYGGIAFSNTALPQDAWGYHSTAWDPDTFLSRLSSQTDAISRIPCLRGFCYTQLTDVMQEVNGLLTSSRQPKADLKLLQDIFSREP